MHIRPLERVAKLKLRVLSEQNCLDVHLATEEILAHTGVAVEYEPARELLRQAGAVVKDDLVFIPAGLLKKALSTAPQMIILHQRDGTPAMFLGGSRCYYGTGSDTPTTVDPDTGEPVSTTYETVARFTRFTDALPNIDFVMSMGIARDKEIASFVAQFAAMVANTTKPIVFTALGIEDLRAIYQMTLALYQDQEDIRLHPRALLYTEPISPLVHTKKELEMVIFCAEKGIPVTVPSGINAGATAPVTLAGAIALANAEVLSALVIHQSVNPGAPFMHGGNVTVMDMRSGGYPYAAPEFHLAFAAFADMARYYHLPVWGLAGAADSKVVDAQAGAEAAYQLLMAHLSGCNLIHDIGYTTGGINSSMEMLLLCDEIISLVKRIGAGIKVTDETLALDVIHEVGPRQHFIAHPHTAEHCRQAWSPRFFDRQHFELWEKAGKKDVREVLREKVKEILGEHTVQPLPDSVLKTLAGIIKTRMNARES